jgi:hypothetical protein
MTDDEIRKRVRERLAEGTLPREVHVMAGLRRPVVPTDDAWTAGSAFKDPCAVCDEQGTQIRYHVYKPPLAFHRRCHTIWREEAERLRSA